MSEAVRSATPLTLLRDRFGMDSRSLEAVIETARRCGITSPLQPVASVALGIAVDDTIHVYHGFIHRVRKGIRPVTALARTYRQAGRAVMTTTIILSAQFLILITSQFVPTTHFGLLTTIGLVAALVFDLILLPALLILIYTWRDRPLNPAKPLEI